MSYDNWKCSDETAESRHQERLQDICDDLAARMEMRLKTLMEDCGHELTGEVICEPGNFGPNLEFTVKFNYTDCDGITISKIGKDFASTGEYLKNQC